MAKLLDSVKALGEKITGEKINGDTLFDAVKDAGEKMTGKEIEGKELNDLIAETAKEYQGGGGTVVVNELPETGEEHTIYELHQNVEPAYNWVEMVTNQMLNDNVAINDGYKLLIFDTYKQMEDIFNTIEIKDEDTNIPLGFAYLRNEDKLYTIKVMLKIPAGQGWVFEECEKISNYKFKIFNDRTFLCILKSYDGYNKKEGKGYGTLYDNTKVELGGIDAEDIAGTYGFILHQATIDAMVSFISVGITNHPVTQLPTAQELVANYLDELIVNEGFIAVEIDEAVKSNIPDNGKYHWVPELENFYQPWEEGAEPSEIYTGELEWQDVPSETVHTEIPYQDIFDGDLEEWIFKPEQGGEKVSYWIYASNKWVNIDDITTPSTSLGVTYSNIRLEQPNVPNVNEAVDIYYGEEKLEINDYYVFYPQTEEHSPIVAYATVSGLPLLTSDTHQFTLKIHPKIVVDTTKDRLSISVNGGDVYQSQWKQEIPSEISVIVEGISQIKVSVARLPL